MCGSYRNAPKTADYIMMASYPGHQGFFPGSHEEATPSAPREIESRFVAANYAWVKDQAVQWTIKEMVKLIKDPSYTLEPFDISEVDHDAAPYPA